MSLIYQLGLFASLSIWCFATAAQETDPQSTPLADQAERADWKSFARTVLDTTDLDQRQADGMSALHWCVFKGHHSGVKTLLQKGASVDPANEYGITPLAIACRFGDLKSAEALIDAGANVKHRLAGDESLLMHACRTGNSQLVEKLIKNGADVNHKQRDGQTSLMWASAAGHVDVVDALINAGADIDTKLRSGFTAFHFAARQGHRAVAHRLLDAGADVNDRMTPVNSSGRSPRKGMSALLLAVESAHYQLAIELVDRGADPNDQRSGFAPLHALSWVRRPSRGDNPEGDPAPIGSGNLGSLQFVRELVARGADVNLQLQRGRYSNANLNPKGATPLLYAAFTNDVPLSKVLVELGANISIANSDGTTPMLAAAGVGVFVADEYPGSESETLATLDQLVHWGGDINDVDQHGETVIHGAAYRSFAIVVDRCVELGAHPRDWHHRNALGSTPREIAQGKRPGSFKPNQSTIMAIDRALKSAGIKPEDWTRSAPGWTP
ncbi:ankyrin repeat domain-containing protein [Stieleria sp. JC731]|uniref:ankyrin repeat domain-containing protein n=1 Tax=Pirellulaceae TaxID=2691357 RepID=UPI001E2AFEAC|nr:ankyrin repeat domain-containing protein [Stieleria sp. JC731]MCC9601895.1 ankyrin repeat domain-containing protein [Stieleria sp. JC731]